LELAYAGALKAVYNKKAPSHHQQLAAAAAAAAAERSCF